MDQSFSTTSIDTQGNALAGSCPLTLLRVRPVSVSDAQFAHGLIRVQSFLPPAALVAAPPPRSWLAVARALHAQGTGTDSRFVPVPDVNPEMALRHVGALLRTPTLTADERDEAVAVLLAHWFIAVILEGGPSAGQLA